MQPHAFEASVSPNKQRRNHRAIKDLAQHLSSYPKLTLTLSSFAVEIGGSPTYERLPSRGWRDLVVSSGTENTTGRKSS